MTRRTWLRVVAVATCATGTAYIVWRWGFSVNWGHWWIAVPLVVAETYALTELYMLTLTMWRMKVRGEPPPPPAHATVDVFIPTYNEPVELVMVTASAAQRIAHPHQTWILDDGDRPEMEQAARSAGIGYITRSAEWVGRRRQAKAGNLNNALFQTDGEFVLVIDADQIPARNILDRTLGWFEDPKMALVQTPHWFYNAPDADPLGGQFPLFYGPIQQGKDGWNAAYFCGSNSVIRREALMQMGIADYVRDVDSSVRAVLAASSRILDRTARSMARTAPEAVSAVSQVRIAVEAARQQLEKGESLAEITYRFQRALDAAGRSRVEADFAGIRADLAELADLDRSGVLSDTADGRGLAVLEGAPLERLAARDWTPIGAIESVARLMAALDVDRKAEAQPITPIVSLSVTEDLATCMEWHAAGWNTAYHHEILVRGLAPEDLHSMLQQRLRWAQGAIQVLLHKNPLTTQGLSWGQRLMYFHTMQAALGGFARVVFFLAPILYLIFAVLPVKAFNLTFVAFYAPFFLLNELLAFSIGFGLKTWRTRQYDIALFPIWIKAWVNAARNVWFRHELPFIVTPKTRPGVPGRFPVRLIWPQLAFMGLLVLAVPIGVVRLLTGDTLTVVGFAINTAWVAYNLTAMSVILEAAAYRPPSRDSTEVVT